MNQNPILAVGSLAFDSIRAPKGNVDRVLGGAANYFSAAASFFSPVQVIAVVGEDFPESHLDWMRSQGIDTSGVERVAGKSFYWVGEYDQNPEPLVQLRGQLISDIGKVLQAKTLPEVDQTLWKQFQPPLAAGTPDPTPEEQTAQFDRFREAFAGEKAMDAFSEGLEEVMAPYEQRGLLKELPVEAQANTEKILVKNASGFDAEVPVSEVRIKQAAPKLQQSLKEKLPSVEVAERAFAWLEPKLTETLTLDAKATQLSQDKAAAEVAEVTKPFVQGKDLLAEAGKPLNEDSLKLLRLEHEADIADRTASERLHRSAATLGMFVALYTLAGFYLYRRDRRVVD